MSMSTGAGFAAFEAAVERAFGARLRSDDAACQTMWSAPANMEWSHPDGNRVNYTFRHASQVIAEIRGGGRHLDWYCSGPLATVGAEIEGAMAREGWMPGPVAA